MPVGGDWGCSTGSSTGLPFGSTSGGIPTDVTALDLIPELLTGLEACSGLNAGCCCSANLLPHSSQKLAVSRFSVPHCWHRFINSIPTYNDHIQGKTV
jgi:hypothetical protein